MRAQVGLAVDAGWSRPVDQLSAYGALLEQQPAMCSNIAASSPDPGTRSGTLRAAVVAPVQIDDVTEYLLYVFRRSSTFFSLEDRHLFAARHQFLPRRW